MADFGKRTRNSIPNRTARTTTAGAIPSRAPAIAPAGASRAATRDEGLRTHMIGVYNLMMAGVAFSGAITLYLCSMPELLEKMASSPVFPAVIFLGTLGLSFFSGAIISSGSVAVEHAFFWIYCALWGAGLAPMVQFIFQSGQPEIVARAFFIAASMFGAMSLYGYTTRTNLGPIGSFLCMLTWGLLLATILNWFVLGSDGFGLVLCYVTVVVFAGITAWETQEIKDSYNPEDSDTEAATKSIFGAFQLYGSFMMIFSRLLEILWNLQGGELDGSEIDLGGD